MRAGIAQSAGLRVDPDDPVAPDACLGDSQPASLPLGDDAERARRSELRPRANTCEHLPERPAVQREGVPGRDLSDRVRRFRARRLDAHPSGRGRRWVERDAADGGRRRKCSRDGADDDERNEGEKRPSHTGWIGTSGRTWAPSNELPLKGDSVIGESLIDSR